MWSGGSSSLSRIAVVMLAIAVAACAGANVNADSPVYRQGFDDGCATATNQDRPGQGKPMRDAGLYESDSNYRAGYTSGLAMCRMGPPRL
jgi:hypothetical protein